MKKEEYELQKKVIIKKNNPNIWWILMITSPVFGALLEEILKFEYLWIAKLITSLVLVWFMVGLFKTINRGVELHKLQKEYEQYGPS